MRYNTKIVTMLADRSDKHHSNRSDGSDRLFHVVDIKTTVAIQQCKNCFQITRIAESLYALNDLFEVKYMIRDSLSRRWRSVI